MSSHSKPRILSFKADGAIAKGAAVKIGSDNDHVAACSANTDSAIGICQNTVSAAEEIAEIALQGGGAKAKAGEAITAGKLLVPGASGSMFQTNASGDSVIGMALESAASGDLFAVEVIRSVATAADQ